MLTLPIGFVLLVGFLAFSVPSTSWGLYLNMHSILIVVGGTVSVLALTTPVRVLRNLVKAIGMLFRPDTDIRDYASEFESLIEDRTLPRRSDNELLNYAVEIWQNGVSPDICQVLIAQRREKLETEITDAAQCLKNLAKYPPALGMTGTVMGLVSLFSNLNAENKASLGPSLGMAMTATFFGLILANAVIMPIADRVQVAIMRHKDLYTHTYELLLLINRRESKVVLSEEVRHRVAA
jgi:chemotaxis protein MotA